VGKQKKSPEWIIEVSCPFCKSVVIEAIDYSALPDDMREKINEGRESGDDTIDHCQHVAFFSDWAYAGSDIPTAWEKEMRLIALAIDEDRGATPGKTIDNNRMEDDGRNLQQVLAKVLPDYDAAFAQEYVEKFDGVSSGGPSYAVVFLRKKKQSAG